MSPSASAPSLLALPPTLDLVSVTPQRERSSLLVALVSTSHSAACPRCQTLSTHFHGYYQRRLDDLPCAGQPIRLRVRLGRYRCETPECPRRTFVERVPEFARDYARRTERLRNELTSLGFAEGGRPGAREAQRLGMRASPKTLLRLVRAAPLPEIATPRVMGVDDWAIRKGQTYGTVTVDLETHRPVDLWSDRTAESWATWLKIHPGVEVISRDRAGAYAQGAREGAPEAIQVADRWHLTANLAEHLGEWTERHRQTLERAAVESPPPESVTTETDPDEQVMERATVLEAEDRPLGLTQAERVGQERRRRQERYETVHRLYGGGMSQRQIAERMGIGRKTVRRFLAAESFPERKPGSGPQRSMLDGYRAFIDGRIEHGRHNAAQIWRELRAAGYPGGYGQVQTTVATILRTKREALPVVEAVPVVKMLRRKIVGLLISERENLAADDQGLLDRLAERSESFREAYDLAQGFMALVRERRGADLTDWLKAASASAVAELKGFVAGLKQDQEAVEAGLTLEWSNGPVEGCINRIKEMKRRMYGRAQFDLLRRRVLHPP